MNASLWCQSFKDGKQLVQDAFLQLDAVSEIGKNIVGKVSYDGGKCKFGDT